ncbi:MAG: LLM class flavin-dependent oxidoreductase [Gammaproteobacteria bacterium]|nr:LLM class flavin-dependent oxidoreductase [Gammaproteobacteria bacterium]MDE0450650.1 LLM class flavin-dependent oxidoreductase [Gammaproteobacteria bacterium]
MEFGVSCGRVSRIDFAAEAEELGFDFCWVGDSPMLASNPWAALALISQRTRRMRIGTGVAIPGLRSAPDMANGIATINQLAPGRVFFGIGTGNTAMRTLGRPPMRVKPFADYIRLVRALLRGEEVEYAEDGDTHAIRFQRPGHGNYDLSGPIPIHVGGFGPRAQAIAGELGDGLITGIPRGGTIAEALANVRRGAERAGRDLRDLDTFVTTALVNLIVLEPGEALDSERVVQQLGPSIMANVHYLVDAARDVGMEPPDYIRPIWDDYLAFHESRDAKHRHQLLHQSHYSYIDEDEARFITPELVRAFGIVGEPDQIIEQLEALEAQGLDGIVFIPPGGNARGAYRDFARDVIARMRAG